MAYEAGLEDVAPWPVQSCHPWERWLRGWEVYVIPLFMVLLLPNLQESLIAGLSIPVSSHRPPPTPVSWTLHIPVTDITAFPFAASSMLLY